jgi:uncharacterized protein YndB with AHSA1/START domain
MSGPMLHAVDVVANASTVFRALTTTQGLAAFWASDSEAEPRVGSVARFGFAGAPVDLRMRIDDLREGRSVTWACLGDFPWWAETTVSWDLAHSEAGQGTTVAFRHDGWAEEYPTLEYARVNYTWGRIMGALQAYLGSGEPQPFLG